MPEKKPLLKSMLLLKCPRCRKGDLFQERNPYVLKSIFKMHENCPHCGLNYEIEIGFFYGSMYVSYGLAIAVSVAVFMAMYITSLLLATDVNFYLYLAIDAILLLILTPYMFQFSRAVWLNLFIKYAPEEKGNFQKNTN